jgi:hypothetical protein
MNCEHLREEHQLIIDPIEQIDRYQQNRDGKNILYEIKGHILEISTIPQILNNRDEVLGRGKRPRQNH